jgi:hypothetical protein
MNSQRFAESAMPRTIYLDTTLWNKLFERAVDPASLTSILKQRGWELAISPHLLYELAKSFRGQRAESRQKAIPLFSYVARFLDFPLACVKQVPDLLVEEVKVAAGQLPRIEPFYQGADRDRMTNEIRRLATGYVDPRFDSMYELRTGQVSDFREQLKADAQQRKAQTETESATPLEGFIQNNLIEPGRSMLGMHIAKNFDLSPKEVRRLARKILSARRFRLCHALVRADLYLNWLRSRGRTVARDTLDDCYHIENAAHCDAYVTDDMRQDFFADSILPVTSVRIHDKKAPLLEWLITTANQ